MAAAEEKDPELEQLIDELAQRYYEEAVEEAQLRERSGVRYVTDEKELEKLVCSKPVVVAIFTSPTCAACQMYKPIFYAYAEEASKKLGDRVAFIEVDVYYLPEKAWEYGVMATPTTLLFKNCKPVDGFVGIADFEMLDDLIKPHLD